MRRTSFAVVCALVSTVVLGSVAEAADPARVRVGLRRLATGLSAPTAVVQPPDGSGRLFVLEQQGRVRVWKSGTLIAAPYLDITDRVQSGGERGLLGIAFHPNFKRNGYLWVAYTDSQGDLRVSQFRGNPAQNAVNKTTEKVFMDITHRDNANHNGGQIAFGPDGYLYVGTGDGGGGGDGPGNAQNLFSPLGKILRVDINRPISASRLYSIPAGNPYASGRSGRPEIWHVGARNPWRFSFDKTYGSLVVADVGQNTTEEINYLNRGQGGLNLGWDCREGNTDTTALYGGSYCAGRTFTPPVFTYTHTASRCSVTGGYVYRGARYASTFGGVYAYADYCTGEIWGLSRINGVWRNALIADHGASVTSFGEDEKGELFLVDSNGDLYQLVPSPR